MAFLLDFVVQDTPHIKTLPIEDPIFVDVGLAWKKIDTSPKLLNLLSISVKIH